MKKFLSLLLCIVMILSVCTTMAVAADGDETEATTDIRDTWWADPAWRAEFNAWCNNYYNDGVSSRTHVYEIGSVAELYAFWRVSLHRKSQYTGSNKGGFNTEDWTSNNFKSLTNYTESLGDAYYSTRFVFKLTSNLDLQGAEWPGIVGFNGTFDGNGYTITNFKQTITDEVADQGSESYQPFYACGGFFRSIAHTSTQSGKATPTTVNIKNLKITDFDLVVNTSVYIKNATSTYQKYHTGTDPNGKKPNTHQAEYYVGCLVGYFGKPGISDVENTVVTGDDGTETPNVITRTLNITNVMLDDANITVLECDDDTNTGRYSYFGGLVGGCIYTGNKMVISDCFYRGNINISSDVHSARVGGFVGDTTGGHTGSTWWDEPIVTYSDCLCMPTVTNNASANAQSRVWTARTNATNYKNWAPNSVDPYNATSDGNTVANNVSCVDYDVSNFVIPDGRENNWYKDEVYGIIPKGLAENVLYKVYAQQTTAPDANGKYKVRVLGVLCVFYYLHQ